MNFEGNGLWVKEGVEVASLEGADPEFIVKTKEGNQITIVIPFSSPANPKDKKNVEVKIQIDSQDEIFRNDKISSINDIKINDYAVVEILENKKIIYLPTIK